MVVRQTLVFVCTAMFETHSLGVHAKHRLRRGSVENERRGLFLALMVTVVTHRVLISVKVTKILHAAYLWYCHLTQHELRVRRCDLDLFIRH